VRLQQDELFLQLIHLRFIDFAIQLIVVGVAARTHGMLLDRLGQFGIVEVKAV
jgi:hypothetical protein